MLISTTRSKIIVLTLSHNGTGLIQVIISAFGPFRNTGKTIIVSPRGEGLVPSRLPEFM